MSDKLVIIDGNSIFYRSFYALPLLTNSSGEFSNAIYGFGIQILNIIQTINPKYMVVSFDASKTTFRNSLYSEYKATRKPMPDELRSQLEPLKKMLNLMHIKYVEKLGIEGDDIIGVISKRFKDTENIIVTGDRDSFQLIDKNVKVYFTKKGTSELKIMGLEELANEYGVSPSQFIDVKALQGDMSDNIPGVAGVGPKTATDLIIKYHDLDGIYANLENISSKSLKEKLINGKESAYLSKKLATILVEDDFELSLDDCKYDFPFSNEVLEFFKHYEFKSLLKNKEYFKFESSEASQKPENSADIKAIKVTSNSEIYHYADMATKCKKFAFYINSSEIHFSIGSDEVIFDLSFNLISSNVNEDEFYRVFKDLFESDEIEKICFDAKREMYNLKRFNIALNNYFDLQVAKYLVDGLPVEKLTDLFDENSLDFIATNAFNYENSFKEKIENENLNFLFYQVETPLTKILFDMENAGFKADKSVLIELKNKYEKEQQELKQEIYLQAGESFNINSPKQLSEILFEKLNLPHKKKMSTSADILENLVDKHPIISLILRYRKITKFLTTYIDGLTPHIDSNGFIHTYFKQTLTSTGRLSSADPNLQNIPIRSEESREIRRMFVASNKDNVLVDADYSQIELRLLAHLSQDKSFIDAFNNHIDIHTRTAAEIFNVPASLVTPEMRRTAKVVNFGIIYGISNFGLAEDLKISPKDAKYYIENFYQLHPEVKNFMENQITKTRETLKATTLFSRTRKILDINASNFMVRNRAERISQNMPLQGTAADIIKIAMVKTYNALKEQNLKAKLIMQVHDELIVDAPVEEKEIVEKILKQQMESAAKLLVPLEVDIKSSYRWSDGH